MTTLKDHIEIVKEFNSWRQVGQKEFDDECCQKRLGQALDAVVLAAERCEKLESALKEIKESAENHSCFAGDWTHEDVESEGGDVAFVTNDIFGVAVDALK